MYNMTVMVKGVGTPLESLLSVSPPIVMDPLGHSILTPRARRILLSAYHDLMYL